MHLNLMTSCRPEIVSTWCAVRCSILIDTGIHNLGGGAMNIDRRNSGLQK